MERAAGRTGLTSPGLRPRGAGPTDGRGPARRQGATQLRPPTAPSALPASHRPGADAARAHGVKALPVALGSELFSEPERPENGSLVSNMASGHWVMRSSLFSRPRATKGPFVPLPGLSGAAPAPHPPALPGPAPPAPRGAPGRRGVAAAWPWRARSRETSRSLSRDSRAGARPRGRGGHLESGRSRQAVEAAGGWPGRAVTPRGALPVPRDRGPPPGPQSPSQAASVPRDKTPSRPPTRSALRPPRRERRPVSPDGRLRPRGVSVSACPSRSGSGWRSWTELGAAPPRPSPRRSPQKMPGPMGNRRARACSETRSHIGWECLQRKQRV